MPGISSSPVPCGRLGRIGDADLGVVIGQGEAGETDLAVRDTRAAGFSVPSEAVEWEWRSTAMGSSAPR